MLLNKHSTGKFYTQNKGKHTQTESKHKKTAILRKVQFEKVPPSSHPSIAPLPEEAVFPLCKSTGKASTALSYVIQRFGSKIMMKRVQITVQVSHFEVRTFGRLFFLSLTLPPPPSHCTRYMSEWVRKNSLSCFSARLNDIWQRGDVGTTNKMSIPNDDDTDEGCNDCAFSVCVCVSIQKPQRPSQCFRSLRAEEAPCEPVSVVEPAGATALTGRFSCLVPA